MFEQTPSEHHTGTPIRAYDRAAVDDFFRCAETEHSRLERDLRACERRRSHAEASLAERTEMHRSMALELAETWRELHAERARTERTVEAILAAAEAEASAILAAAQDHAVALHSALRSIRAVRTEAEIENHEIDLDQPAAPLVAVDGTAVPMGPRRLAI